MRLSNVAALYAMRLRAQLGQELLALVGIAVGVSLLFAALVANTSLNESYARMTRDIVGAARFQLTSRGAGYDEAMLGRVQRLPGVESAAAILEARTEIRNGDRRRSIQLIGVTPDFARLGGSLTRGISFPWLGGVHALALPTPIVRALGVRLGQPVSLDVDGRYVRARLGAKLQASDIGTLVGSPVAIAPLSYAQQLLHRPGRISRVFVRPRPGHEAEVARGLARLAAGRGDVRPADFDAVLFRQASSPTSQSTAMFSVFSALVGFLFAFSAVLLTVPQRRRLIADLRVEGYGRGTIVKVLLFDALVLGAVAAAVGIVAGDQLARRLFDDRPAFLDMAFAFGSERITTPATVLIAAAGGLLASLVAVLGPMTPSLVRDDEQEQSAGGRDAPVLRRLLLGGGIALLAAATAIVSTQPASAALGIAGLALLTAAMLLLLPFLLRVVVGLVDAATRATRSIVPFLAISDLRDPATRLRSFAVAATGAIAVLGSVALQGAHADLQRGLDRTAGDLASIGDVWAVAPGPANLLATTSFSRPPLQRVPAGLSAIVPYRGSFLDVGDRRVWVIGAPASARHPLARGQMIDGDTGRATRLLRAGGWAVVSWAVARDLHLHVGDRFALPSPAPLRLRVSALSTNMGWPPGAIVVNADDYARAWGSSDVSGLTATLAPGTTPQQGRRLLRTALGAHTGLVVKTAADRRRAMDAGSRQGLARLTEIAAMVLVGAMIAMAAAMAGMIWQRRAFLAAMKVEGYTTAELWRSLLLEAAVLVAAGCAIGAAFGLLGQRLLSRALTTVTGFPVDYATALAGAVLTCAAVTVVAVAIIGAFGRRAARIAPESGLR